jgi:fluoroquinolone resistance protein
MRDCELHQIGARGISITGADLRGANLDGLDIRNIDMTGVTINEYQQTALLLPLGIVVIQD